MDTLKIYRNWKLDEVNQRKSFREEALKTRNFDSYKSEDLKKSNFFKSSSINFNIFSSPKPQKQYEKYCRSPTEEKKISKIIVCQWKLLPPHCFLRIAMSWYITSTHFVINSWHYLNDHIFTISFQKQIFSLI